MTNELKEQKRQTLSSINLLICGEMIDVISAGAIFALANQSINTVEKNCVLSIGVFGVALGLCTLKSIKDEVYKYKILCLKGK